VTSLMTAGECGGASVSYYDEGNAPIPADCFPDADAGFQNTGVLATGKCRASGPARARRRRMQHWRTSFFPAATTPNLPPLRLKTHA
jgi:hypothetical protein